MNENPDKYLYENTTDKMKRNEKKRRKKKKKEEWTGDVSEQKASGVKMVLFNGGVT